jgi:hypothetical protein
MLERIFARKLAIQWVKAVEAQDIEFGYPLKSAMSLIAR